MDTVLRFASRASCRVLAGGRRLLFLVPVCCAFCFFFLLLRGERCRCVGLSCVPPTPAAYSEQSLGNLAALAQARWPLSRAFLRRTPCALSLEPVLSPYSLSPASVHLCPWRLFPVRPTTAKQLCPRLLLCNPVGCNHTLSNEAGAPLPSCPSLRTVPQP